MAIELKRGIIFDSYTLLENIGSGSTAEVWLVENKDGQQKAMKIYSPSNKLSEFDKKILKKEFDFAKNLSHRNILPLEKYGEFKGVPYIIMPMAASSLMGELHWRMSKYNDQLPYFSENQLVTILYEVSNALDYLKPKKIIHKDLKPDNVLILVENDEERLVLMDFNISKSLKQKILSQTRSLSENTTGMTPAYAAPEFLLGNEHQKSDIFSLGITLYELATGNIPTSSPTHGPAEILINGGELPILDIENFSEGFKTLIKLCLNVDPENRPSAKQLNEWADYFMNNDKWPDDVFKLDQKINFKKNDFNDNFSNGAGDKANNPNPYDGKQTIHEDFSINQNIYLIPDNANNFSFNKNTSNEKISITSKLNKLLKNLFFQLVLLLGVIILITIIIININKSKKANSLTNLAEAYYYDGKMNKAIDNYSKAYKIKNSDIIKNKKELAEKLINKYKIIKPFEENNKIARVQSRENNLWGLIDNQGNEILKPSKLKIARFHNGQAEYQNKNKKEGLINSKGYEIK